jgi:hypothetical protein
MNAQPRIPMIFGSTTGRPEIVPHLLIKSTGPRREMIAAT